ncbi:MAG: SusC/RagA family TonB-linked outer membrane protein, partial [Pricia sp.]
MKGNLQALVLSGRRFLLIGLLFCAGVSASAQTGEITGVVTDTLGTALPGVNVYIKGGSTGTQTDFDGRYSINATPEQTLVFSYVGFAKQEKQVGSSETIDISLRDDVFALEDVVVVAYGSEKRSEVTSAISQVESESIEQVPTGSLDQILQGQAAGLNIQTNTGQPGADATVILRGRSSINGDVEPLFVIDGVPVDGSNFRSLNPNDIESVSVLKDASASAVYGSRAGGGVVLVTTKKGEKDSGVSLQYRTQYGVSDHFSPKTETMNSRQYLTYLRRRGFAAYADLTDAEITEQSMVNTDWEEIFFRTGRTQQHEFNMTTGNDKTTTYSSVAYFDQEGITLRSDLQRFTVRNNTTTTLNDNFEFSSNLSVGFSTNNFALTAAGALDNPVLNAYAAYPFLDPFNEDGSLDIVGDGGNDFNNSPFISLNTANLNQNRESELKIIGNISASWEFVDNLTLGTNIGVDYQHNESKDIIAPNSIRGQTGVPNLNAERKGSQFESFYKEAGINVNTFLKYANTLN